MHVCMYVCMHVCMYYLATCIKIKYIVVLFYIPTCVDTYIYMYPYRFVGWQNTPIHEQNLSIRSQNHNYSLLALLL